ncbi:uncharacterized protein [Chelonus insularis]|uniref:uncharacterized protein n=1 Tax=Chelonus insularis TaxID=460826 RepID=UPI001589AEC4|nr:uncharacterized protein LOC118072329 [Chelonus insularis]
MLSPYITAIQKVKGRTSGEKFQTLHQIAKNIIENGKWVNGMYEVEPSEELPEPLIPLVKVEIALLIQQPTGIIDALKSEDETVFNRALKAKWFFDGSVKNYPDPVHFRDEICPVISVQHRLKIIKVLANNLGVKKLTSTAEEFYNIISKSYGNFQARRLLKICSEPFITNVIKNQQITLSLGEVNYLFSRYPNMIIEYLKIKKNKNPLLYPCGTFVEDYIKFLPRLLKKHSHEFVEIIRIHGYLSLPLKSHHHIELFLKKELDALIKDPRLFLPMLPTKEVIKRLTPQQIAEVAKVFFPKAIENFNFDVLYKEILMYVPQDQQMPIIMSCFEDVYKKSLLNCPNQISAQAMRLLPTEERIKQARKKIEIDNQWYIFSSGWYTTRSWRCYLPIEESIPLIKEKIKEVEDAGERVSLLTQLIYTCRINDDNDALLDVLKYIVARHRNERGWVWKTIFDRLELDFQLQLLPSEHWDILYDIILNNVDNPTSDYETIFEFWNMIKYRIHFDLIHNQPISDKIKLMIRISSKNTGFDKWNLIEEVPEYEKKCLEEFITLVPIELSEEKQNHSYIWKTVTLELVRAIYNFNERHCKKTEDQSQKLRVKNYPSLVDAIKNIFNELNQPSNEYYIEELKLVLEPNEPEILSEIQPVPSKKVSVINLEKAVAILHRQPERILKNWEKYYRKCKKLCYQNYTIRFLRACRWYQDIPVKFIEQAIEEFHNEKAEEALMIAAAILDGPSFEQFITPYLPVIDPNNQTFLDKEDPVLSTIQECLKHLNPPISLDFVLKFCKPDYIHCILEYVLCLRGCAPVHKLLPFCDKLTNQAVSVRKHITRLLRITASDEQLCTRLISLWRRETHKSVRLIIALHIFNCFIEYPSPKSWKNMSECFDDLKAVERNILEVLLRKITKVSNGYIMDYIKKLLYTFERIGDHEKSMYPYGVGHYILNLFRIIMNNIAYSFPEELHRELLEKYLVNTTFPKEILTVARNYLIVVYIESAGDKLDDRLEFFSDIFTRIVKDKWDVPANEIVSFCPANYFVHQLTQDIVYQMKYSSTKSKLIDTALKTFLTLLQPQQEPEFYCTFSFAALYSDKMPWEEFTSKIHQLLPSMVKIFSTEFIYCIARFLHKIIKQFYDEEIQLDIVEQLVNFNDNNANSLAAALLLMKCHPNNDERFWRIFRALRKHRNPLMTSSAYLAVHSIVDYAS